MSSHHVRQLLGRPIRLTAGCDVACTVTARGSLTIRAAGQSAVTSTVAPSGVLRPNRTAIAAGKRVRLVLRIRHAAVLRAFPAVRRGGIAELHLRLTATGATGTTVSPPFRFRLLLPPGSRR